VLTIININYKLFATIIHSGESLSGGHLRTFINMDPILEAPKWFEFNDAVVYSVTEDRVFRLSNGNGYDSAVMAVYLDIERYTRWKASKTIVDQLFPSPKKSIPIYRAKFMNVMVPNNRKYVPWNAIVNTLNPSSDFERIPFHSSLKEDMQQLKITSTIIKSTTLNLTPSTVLIAIYSNPALPLALGPPVRRLDTDIQKYCRKSNIIQKASYAIRALPIKMNMEIPQNIKSRKMYREARREAFKTTDLINRHFIRQNISKKTMLLCSSQLDRITGSITKGNPNQMRQYKSLDNFDQIKDHESKLYLMSQLSTDFIENHVHSIANKQYVMINQPFEIDYLFLKKYEDDRRDLY
jgi:hypothetical protein